MELLNGERPKALDIQQLFIGWLGEIIECRMRSYDTWQNDWFVSNWKITSVRHSWLHSAEIYVIHWLVGARVWVCGTKISPSPPERRCFALLLSNFAYGIRITVCFFHFSFALTLQLWFTSCVWRLSHWLSLAQYFTAFAHSHAHTHIHTHFVILWKCGTPPSFMPKMSVYKRALMG